MKYPPVPGQGAAGETQGAIRQDFDTVNEDRHEAIYEDAGFGGGYGGA